MSKGLVARPSCAHMYCAKSQYASHRLRETAGSSIWKWGICLKRNTVRNLLSEEMVRRTELDVDLHIFRANKIKLLNIKSFSEGVHFYSKSGEYSMYAL